MLRIRFGNTGRITISFLRGAGLVLLFLGIVSLVAAIMVYSSVPAMIGLGLIFWGIILIYIQTDEYMKKTVLDSTTTSLLTALNETLETLEYRGKAIYLPPKYVNDPEFTKIYISKLETGTLPTPDTTQKLETQPAQRNTQALLITPPGAELARLVESTLGTSFLSMNLENLQQRLPKTLVEDLEVATDFEIQQFSTKEKDTSTENDEAGHETISVKFTTVAYKETNKRAAKMSAIYANIGCPLSSAIAVALSKVTGKPIVIKSQHISEDGQTNETQYTIVEEHAS